MAYNLISIDEVVAMAFTLLDSEESRDEILFENWAWDAVREIGPTRVSKRKQCLPVIDRCITKPKDFCYAIDMSLLDPCNNAHYFQYSESGWLASTQRYNNDSSTLYLNSGSTYNCIKVTETNCTFELSQEADCENIVKAELLYYHLPLDDQGRMLIEENLKLAIIAYIEYCFYKMHRARSRHPGKTNMVPMSEVDWYYNKWVRLKSQKKAEARMPDILSASTIFNNWVTGIPNYQRNYRSRIFRGFNRYNSYYR